MTQLNRAEDWHLVKPRMLIYRARTRRKVRERVRVRVRVKVRVNGIRVRVKRQVTDNYC